MLSERTRNRIGAVGFLLLLLGGGVYAAWAYWPVSWTKGGELVRKDDLSGISPENMKDKLAKLDMKRLSADQKAQLAVKFEAYMEGLSREDRRDLIMRNGGFWGDQGPATQPSDVAAANIRALLEEARMQRAREFVKASPEQKQALLDKALDEMDARRRAMQDRAATQPGTQPGGGGGGGGRGWGGGGGPGGGGGGPGGGGGGPNNGSRVQRAAQRTADALENQSASDRAAMRAYRDAMNAARQQRGK